MPKQPNRRRAGEETAIVKGLAQDAACESEQTMPAVQVSATSLQPPIPVAVKHTDTSQQQQPKPISAPENVISCFSSKVCCQISKGYESSSVFSESSV